MQPDWIVARQYFIFAPLLLGLLVHATLAPKIKQIKLPNEIVNSLFAYLFIVLMREEAAYAFANGAKYITTP